MENAENKGGGNGFMKAVKKVLWTILLIILLAGAGFSYFKWWWVFSDGTKTGELNSLTYTGYLFKTYEGELILTGYGNKNNTGSVQSKNFKFSVADKKVAEEMTQMTGLRITVHYKEYKGTLPWRGYEKSIVDSVQIENAGPALNNDEPIFL